MLSGIHCGSWNINPMDKGGLLYRVFKVRQNKNGKWCSDNVNFLVPQKVTWGPLAATLLRRLRQNEGVSVHGRWWSLLHEPGTGQGWWSERDGKGRTTSRRWEGEDDQRENGRGGRPEGDGRGLRNSVVFSWYPHFLRRAFTWNFWY